MVVDNVVISWVVGTAVVDDRVIVVVGTAVVPISGVAVAVGCIDGAVDVQPTIQTKRIINPIDRAP